jgi:hypothetical protein
MIQIERGFYIKKSSRKNKKYDIYTQDENKYKYLLSFGDNRYEQYKDSTPLKEYSNLNHSDEKRRANYYKRHGFTVDRKTAKYWSNKYLW